MLKVGHVILVPATLYLKLGLNSSWLGNAASRRACTKSVSANSSTKSSTIRLRRCGTRSGKLLFTWQSFSLLGVSQGWLTYLSYLGRVLALHCGSPASAHAVHCVYFRTLLCVMSFVSSLLTARSTDQRSVTNDRPITSVCANLTNQCSTSSSSP